MAADKARGESHGSGGQGFDWAARGADAEGLKEAMRHFPTGVTVLSCGNGERAEAMTANAVVSVSLDPPLFLVSVHREARINARIREEGSFAASILAGDQEGLSRLFASPERSSGLSAVKSMGGGYGSTGAPLVGGALAAIECELAEVYPGGDHDLFLGRISAIWSGDARKGPLVYYEGGYPTLKNSAGPGESGAFMDSARGFDARLSRAGRKRRR